MGDDAIFKIVDGNKVLLQKVSQIDKRYLKSLDTMLSEWSSKEDDEAFDDLQNV
jgi:hypothetical protein